MDNVTTQRLDLNYRQVLGFVIEGLLQDDEVLILRSQPCTDKECPNYGKAVHAVTGLSTVPVEQASELANLYLHPGGKSEQQQS